MSNVLTRAFSVLELLATTERPLRLMELVERTGEDKSAVHRLMTMLSSEGIVQRDPDTLQYRLGPRFIALAADAFSRTELIAVAQPFVTQLRDLTGETVSVHMRVEYERICLTGAESKHEIRSTLPTGERRPLHTGVTGRVIFAYLSGTDATRAAAIAASDGVNSKVLQSQLRKIRSLGGLWEVSDRRQGAMVASIPIFDAHSVIGCLTVSGPEARWTGRQVARHFSDIRQAASKITSGIGGKEPEDFIKVKRAGIAA